MKGRRKDGRKGRKGNPTQGTDMIEPKSNTKYLQDDWVKKQKLPPGFEP